MIGIREVPLREVRCSSGGMGREHVLSSEFKERDTWNRFEVVGLLTPLPPDRLVLTWSQERHGRRSCLTGSDQNTRECDVAHDLVRFAEPASLIPETSD